MIAKENWLDSLFKEVRVVVMKRGLANKLMVLSEESRKYSDFSSDGRPYLKADVEMPIANKDLNGCRALLAT